MKASPLLALLMAIAVALALAACSAPAHAPQATDTHNPPAGNCVRTRPGIALDADGNARTVQACSHWYFGPSREQDTRFKAGRDARD